MITTYLPELWLSPFVHRHAEHISWKCHDNISTSFLTPIIGCPTYQTLATIHLKLNVSAASVFWTVTMVCTAYWPFQSLPKFTWTPQVWRLFPPVNPGLHPNNISATATNAQIAHATRVHEHFCEEWQEWVATDIALKINLLTQLIIFICIASAPASPATHL